MTWRRPVWAMYVLIVGLALHNVAMSLLWRAGVRGAPLTAISAWKDVLLLVALVLVVVARRGLPFASSPADWLALVFAAFVVVYGLLPQSLLGGGATHKGVAYAARHDLLPVGAYFLGRGLDLTERERTRLCRTILMTAAGVAVYGLVDVYAVPLSWWRGSAGWFHDQLGLDYVGLSHLPENFVYNVGNGVVFRRLTSTFLSPLASSYVFVVALLLAVAWLVRRRPSLAVWTPLAALLLAGLLWTHSRSSYFALVAGLVAIALVRRRQAPALLVSAAVVLVAGFVFVKAYSHVAPTTRFTPTELAEQRANAHKTGSTAGGGFSDASTASHWRSLRAGVRRVVHHPQGYGVGNAGSTAARTGTEVEAGESTYTELGVDAGLVGALLFVAWSLALLREVLPCTAWLGGALVAVFLLGLQTDVLGVPWLAYVLWILAGAVVTTAANRLVETRPLHQE
jgi:hypothetical protein